MGFKEKEVVKEYTEHILYAICDSCSKEFYECWYPCSVCNRVFCPDCNESIDWLEHDYISACHCCQKDKGLVKAINEVNRLDKELKTKAKKISNWKGKDDKDGKQVVRLESNNQNKVQDG